MGRSFSVDREHDRRLYQLVKMDYANGRRREIIAAGVVFSMSPGAAAMPPAGDDPAASRGIAAVIRRP
jgi:hypothetical protein